MPYDFPPQASASFPSMVVVSITNACDFRCTHCHYPRYAQGADYRRHDMQEAVFRKAAEEIGRHPESILRLIAWGEPLLHPKVIDFTRYARQAAPRNRITLITNGYWLTPTRSRALMDAGLDLVEISIDAATPERYAEIRVSRFSDAFWRVEHNVREMLRIRDEMGFNARIAVSYILHPTAESKSEYETFERKWNRIADEVIKRPAHTFKGAVPAAAVLPCPRKACYSLWARCHVNPWGQVNVCYNDWENGDVLGDLRDHGTSIGGIWREHALNDLRAGQCRGVFRGICSRCRDYNPDSWERPYEHVVSRCHAKHGTGGRQSNRLSSESSPSQAPSS